MYFRGQHWSTLLFSITMEKQICSRNEFSKCTSNAHMCFNKYILTHKTNYINQFIPHFKLYFNSLRKPMKFLVRKDRKMQVGPTLRRAKSSNLCVQINFCHRTYGFIGYKKSNSQVQFVQYSVVWANCCKFGRLLPNCRPQTSPNCFLHKVFSFDVVHCSHKQWLCPISMIEQSVCLLLVAGLE